MTDTVNGNSSSFASGAAYTTPDTAQFHNIDEMQEACESDGWCVEFRQLQAGKLTANTVSGQSADISLLDHCVSRRIEAIGEAPNDHITVLAPAGRGEFWANGRTFDGQGLFLLGPGAQLHTVNNQILRVLSMHVPVSLLQQISPGILDVWESRASCQTLLIEAGGATVRRLRSLMHTTIHHPITDRLLISRTTALTTILTAIIEQHAGNSDTTGRTSREEAWHTIKRAREFIDAKLADPISISDICVHSSTSLSKLERLFRRELHMSPSQYILARRLSAVNGELKQSNRREKQVARIALDHGFNHLGRFAGVYRKQFGELPSDTLCAD